MEAKRLRIQALSEPKNLKEERRNLKLLLAYCHFIKVHGLSASFDKCTQLQFTSKLRKENHYDLRIFLMDHDYHHDAMMERLERYQKLNEEDLNTDDDDSGR